MSDYWTDVATAASIVGTVLAVFGAIAALAAGPVYDRRWFFVSAVMVVVALLLGPIPGHLS